MKSEHRKKWLRQVAVFALLYLVVALGLDAVIFLLSHIPPTAINLDGVILRLGDLAKVLVWPRLVLRRLWPGESTPLVFNYLLPLVNCLVWALALTGVRSVWRAIRK